MRPGCPTPGPSGSDSRSDDDNRLSAGGPHQKELMSAVDETLRDMVALFAAAENDQKGQMSAAHDKTLVDIAGRIAAEKKGMAEDMCKYRREEIEAIKNIGDARIKSLRLERQIESLKQSKRIVELRDMQAKQEKALADTESAFTALTAQTTNDVGEEYPFLQPAELITTPEKGSTPRPQPRNVRDAESSLSELVGAAFGQMPSTGQRKRKRVTTPPTFSDEGAVGNRDADSEGPEDNNPDDDDDATLVRRARSSAMEDIVAVVASHYTSSQPSEAGDEPPPSTNRNLDERAMQGILGSEHLARPVVQVFLNYMQPVLSHAMLNNLREVLDGNPPARDNFDRLLTLVSKVADGWDFETREREARNPGPELLEQRKMRRELSWNAFHYDGSPHGGGGGGGGGGGDRGSGSSGDRKPPRFGLERVLKDAMGRACDPSPVLCAFLRTKHAARRPHDSHLLGILLRGKGSDRCPAHFCKQSLGVHAKSPDGIWIYRRTLTC